MTLKVTVVATVLNEEENIYQLMDSLVAQTRPPDEVIIVDGGSTDNTVTILHHFCDRLPLRIRSAPGTNISQGRNMAIAAAQGQIIAATDAGLWLSPVWIEKLLEPFEADPDLRVVGGFFQPDARSPFEMAMGAAVTRLVDEINPQAFLPGSRSIAYRKTDWEAVNGYPEWLDYGEDMAFVLNLRRLTMRFAFAPQAVVNFRPRSSLQAFFRQYYYYARGDGKADVWRYRHGLRYFTYGCLVPMIMLLGLTADVRLWLLYLPGAVLYLFQPYRRLFSALRSTRNRSALNTLYVLALLPIIRMVGDAGKMAGYPSGVVWRWRHRPPDWRYEGNGKR
jgi:glycosyltransferase involved in cell wall biosynthesis